MGVYIKNMEMPKSCWRCTLSQLYEKPREMLVCKITHEEVIRHKIDSNCPLVPVPPHGRLIDKDVMCNECRRIAEEYDGIYPDCTYCPAHLAPTIIEAEEGE